MSLSKPFKEGFQVTLAGTGSEFTIGALTGAFVLLAGGGWEGATTGRDAHPAPKRRKAENMAVAIALGRIAFVDNFIVAVPPQPDAPGLVKTPGRG